MVIALDPRVPRVWRTPDTLQFGVDAPRLVLHPVSVAEERMIAALADGVSVAGLRMIAKRSRAAPDSVDALLAKVASVLEPSPIEAAPSPLVIVDGEGRTAGRIVGHLRAEGVDVRSGLSWSDPLVESATLAVIVGSYAIEPSRHGHWLRRDIPHLPVVFSDGGVDVGPLVQPGRGACVRCVDLHRADADPAWPAMAAQLHGRPRPGETELVSEAVAAAVAALVVSRVYAPDSPCAVVGSRFDARAGGWIPREHLPHPECGCLGLSVTPRETPPASPPLGPDARAEPAPPGSGTAGATPAARDSSRDAPS
jgi:bacteriocin biosynthesis cyclodehydratase domain-containing protein